jgi:hypothetical protein
MTTSGSGQLKDLTHPTFYSPNRQTVASYDALFEILGFFSRDLVLDALLLDLC